MAFPEGAHRGRAQPGVPQQAHPPIAREQVAVAARGAFAEGLRGDTAMIDDARMEAAAATPESRPRGQAGRIGDIAVVEAHTICRQRVDVWARLAVIAIAAQVVGPQTVDIDVEDTRRFSPSRLVYAHRPVPATS
jgi:hypothetical protein